MLDVPIQRLLTDAMELTYFGETGETLLISRVGNELVHLHPVRFDQDIQTLAKMDFKEGASGAAKKAMFGFQGAGIVSDYRNEQVLASWRYSPALDWGLVSKIDAKEIFLIFLQGVLEFLV